MCFAPELATESAGFESENFAGLAKLEPHSAWFKSRNDLIAWAVKRWLPDCRDFLEVGCGTGFVLARIRAELPVARLVGTEIYTAGLAFAAERVPSSGFYQMDARQCPFEGEFDGIGAFDVLEHIEDDETVLKNLWAALRPDGRLLLTVPQHPSLWSDVDVLSSHVRRYSAAEILGKVRAAGFEVLATTSFVSLPLPAMLLTRRKPINGKVERTLMEALTLSPAAEWGLSKVLAVEEHLIRLGFRFPIGGSRLVVARRKSAISDPEPAP